MNQNRNQAPLHSGFDETMAAQEVMKNVDLTGKTAIVTGGYCGIGLGTTRALANAGATVIVPARDMEKAKSALNNISGVEIDTLNLMDPDSIDAFAKRFVDSGRPLKILINNAGVMAAPLRRDSRGYESQFSTNHLGHFQLTARLWPALVKAKGARVVTLTSRGHRISSIDFDDPNFENRPYNKWIAYAQSKTADSLFALELDNRGCDQGVRAFTANPGAILTTDLCRHLTKEDRPPAIFDKDGKPVYSNEKDYIKTIDQGAATSLWCAVSPQLQGLGGLYCEDVDVAETVPADSLKKTGARPWAIDPDMAIQLWQLSERLTGVRFLD